MSNRSWAHLQKISKDNETDHMDANIYSYIRHVTTKTHLISIRQDDILDLDVSTAVTDPRDGCVVAEVSKVVDVDTDQKVP